MTRSASRLLASSALLALSVLATAGAFDPDKTTAGPGALPVEGPVDVRWRDPESFSEIRYSHNPRESRRGHWVQDLAEYTRQRAQSRLPEGQTLEVEFVDIDRAGEFEPWRGIDVEDTRFIRDIYPPRIVLTFKRTDASGAVIAEGERKLLDVAFMGSVNRMNTDTLRYEKQMIDQWLAREMPKS
jgi:hypothetical protein